MSTPFPPTPESLSLRIAEVTLLNPSVKMLRLVPAGEHKALPGFSPGAHIGLEIPLSDGTRDWRQYSLISMAGPIEPSSPRDAYVVAVRLEKAGRGGSRFVHEKLQVGDTISVRPPRNDFPMEDTDAWTILVAGGIGVTPLATMAAHRRSQNKPVRLHYAGRDRSSMALLDDLTQLLGSDAVVHADDEANAPFSVGTVFDSASQNDHIYVCGPVQMLDAVLAEARRRSWPEGRVHFELFSAPPKQEGDHAFELVLSASHRVIQVPADKSILDRMIEEGLDPVFDCKRGECGVCAVTVLAGEVDHRDYVLTEREKQTGNVMHTCVSRCKGTRLTIEM